MRRDDVSSRRRRSRPSTRPPGPRRARGPMRRSTAASKAGTPRARKPAITPVSTSPDPAVASAALPVSFSATRPGRPPRAGSAMTVPGPFRRTTAPLRSASRCAAAIRSSPTGWPASRAYSPSWGVSTVGTPRVWRGAQRLEIAVERVEAVGVEHERDARLGDEREHRLRAPTGPDRGRDRARAHGTARCRRAPRRPRAARAHRRRWRAAPG